jgi:hypothetical protein
LFEDRRFLHATITGFGCIKSLADCPNRFCCWRDDRPLPASAFGPAIVHSDIG